MDIQGNLTPADGFAAILFLGENGFIPARLKDSTGKGFWSLSRLSPGLFWDEEHGNDPLRSLQAVVDAAKAKLEKA